MLGSEAAGTDLGRPGHRNRGVEIGPVGNEVVFVHAKVAKHRLELMGQPTARRLTRPSSRRRPSLIGGRSLSLGVRCCLALTQVAEWSGQIHTGQTLDEEELPLRVELKPGRIPVRRYLEIGDSDSQTKPL